LDINGLECKSEINFNSGIIKITCILFFKCQRPLKKIHIKVGFTFDMIKGTDLLRSNNICKAFDPVLVTSSSALNDKIHTALAYNKHKGAGV